MRVVRARLVGRNEYGSLIFGRPGCSNAIAREKLAPMSLCGLFGTESIRGSANGRFRLLERIYDPRLGQIFVKNPESMRPEKKDLKTYGLRDRIGKHAA